MGMERIKWIDQSKGMAIFLVVVGHVIANGHSSGIVDKNGLWPVINRLIYSFHMPLFFLISGYLAMPKFLISNGLGGVIKSLYKLLYLLIPYIVFSSIYLFMKIAFAGSGAVSNPVELTDILFIYKSPIGEYWFLYALILYNILNLIAVIAAKICKNERVYWGFIILYCILGLLTSTKTIDVSTSVLYFEGLRRPYINAFYFYLGILIAYSSISIEKAETILNMISAIILSSLYIHLLSPDSPIFRVILAMTLIIFTIQLFSWQNIDLLGYVGEKSLIIYLLHPFIIVLCKIFLSSWCGEHLYVLMASLISVAFPLLLHEYAIKRMKYLNFVFEPKKYI